MKRILYFTHEKAFGGASKALLTLIDEIVNDYDIYVVVPFKKSKMFDELKKRNVKVISCFYSWWQIPTNINFIKKLVFKSLYKLNFISVFKLTKKIKNLKIDIIHSNTSVIDVGSIVSKKLNIPHIWHFREFNLSHLNFIKNKQKSFDFINNNTDYIIYISNSLKEYYSKFIYKPINRVIYDGIPSVNNYCKIYKKKYDTINFVQVATLEQNKGQDISIKAAAILKEKGYKNFKILFAGGDPIGYSSYLNKLIIQNQLEDHIEYIGFVKDILKLRQKADVELMCSLYEAFGLVTVEGMMMGNPIIGSDACATKEIIVDKQTGLLFEVNNYIDLANKMQILLDNNEFIKKYGNNSKKRALKNFTSRKHAKNIKEFYKEIESTKKENKF